MERATPVLNIPGKTLEDNFKLKDFQSDFSDVLRLALNALAKPSRVEFTNMSGMRVRYEDGRTVDYRFERRGSQITKIINLTDNTELVITW
ncbi:MAG: hypothetical protein ACRC68_00860 [Clostridium sp.]